MRRDAASAPPYRTAEAARGALVVAVSATGNLEPTNQVDVGSELSGIVEAVYVDDNDLDAARASLARARANLASARAGVALARATLQ